MPHTPILALTSIATAAVLGNTFVGFGGATAAAAAKPLGIADYDAVIGGAFAVTVLGTQRVVAGGAFAKGASLQVAADGKAVVLAAGVKAAVALEDSAGDGSIVTVLLTP
jgi:hypothetical protein